MAYISFSGKRIYKTVNGRSQAFWNRHAREEHYQGDRICIDCGSKENIHIHHKNQNISDNRPENLVALCKSCHSRLHTLKENNTAWNGGQVKKICKQCNKEYYVHPYQKEGKRESKYCSMNCYLDYSKEHKKRDKVTGQFLRSE